MSATSIGNLKMRVSGLKSEAGHVRVGLAEVNSRIDRLEARLARIERRLDLVNGPAVSGDLYEDAQTSALKSLLISRGAIRRPP